MRIWLWFVSYCNDLVGAYHGWRSGELGVLNASEHTFPWRDAYSSIGYFPDALAISFANLPLRMPC